MSRPIWTPLYPVLFALLLMPAAALAEGAPGAAPAEKVRFDYALSLYMKGAYDSAVAELKEFIKAYPRGEYTDDAYYWLGKYYMMTGVYEDAVEQFRTILATAPTGDKAPYAQFEVAGYWSDPLNPKYDCQKAMAEYLKIPFFYPESPLADDARYYAATCQLRLGNYPKAEEEFKSFMDKSPDSELAAPAAYLLGLSYLQDGRPDDALASFQALRDKHPGGLYADKALYAIESLQRARQKRPIEAKYSYGAKGGQPGQFLKPSDAASDEEGYIYVADSGNGRIQRLKAGDGGLECVSANIVMPSIDKNLQPVRPAGIAVGPKGAVYITDPGAGRVQAYQPDGRLALSFGRKGSGPGELDSPAGLAVDEAGNIYVADRGNRRVDRFDPSGRFVGSIGNQAGDNALKAPAGVALDLQGNVLVTDSSADRLYKYDPSGRLLLVYANTSPERYVLDGPSGIAVDAVGNVYVTNRGRESVLVLDRDLKPITEYMGGSGGKNNLDTPAGICVYGPGTLFIADPGSNKIVVLR